MTDTQIPDYYSELARPCKRAAALVFSALQTLGEYSVDSVDYNPVAAGHLRLALALLASDLQIGAVAQGAGRALKGAPRPEAAQAAGIEGPRYRAAALVFTALQALGEYPAGAPDYDSTAVEHLRLALARLAPGFGHLQPLPPAAVEAPAAGPAWVDEVLAEATGMPAASEAAGAPAPTARGGLHAGGGEARPGSRLQGAPADLCEARSWTLFTASTSELLYGSGLKGILEARAEDDPGFQVALACIQRREHQAAASALRPALAAWTPATIAQVREQGFLTLAVWLLGLRQFKGSEHTMIMREPGE